MEITQAPIPQLPKFAAECRELLEKWDNGETIWTLEMGGMGPGYEQCIQIMAVEFTRAAIDLPLEGPDEEKNKTFSESCDLALKPINEQLGGVSGAQWGAAKWLAYKWLHVVGPAGLQAEAKQHDDADRCILADKGFPHLKAA